MKSQKNASTNRNISRRQNLTFSKCIKLGYWHFEYKKHCKEINVGFHSHPVAYFLFYVSLSGPI